MKIIICIPVYNEEQILKKNIEKLYDFCKSHLGADLEWKIVIANNASTDRSESIAKSLSEQYGEVELLNISQKGKGHAIRAAWEGHDADCYAFMDVDLATDLGALPKAIEAVSSGSDIAYGSRFASGSKVERDLMRRIFSFGYRLVIKMLLRTAVDDAPCGFKVINRKVRDRVMPKVLDQGWFFDSEMLLLAERMNFRLRAIPVFWKEFADKGRISKVNILELTRQYIQKVMELRKRFGDENE